MRRAYVAFAAFASLMPSVAIAQGIFEPPSGYIGPAIPSRSLLRDQLHARLKGILREGLAQQTADGGTLTAAHRTALQAKIEAAKATYVEQTRDMASRNSDGSLANKKGF